MQAPENRISSTLMICLIWYCTY